MALKRWGFPALAFTAVVAACIGFGATHVWDNRAIGELTAERDAARDCRQSGSTVAPCPVVYRNTRIEWRDRVQTVQAPDPQQARRIAALSAELTSAHRTIHNLVRRQARQRIVAANGWQNGTRQYPYNTAARCPAGDVVLYDAGLSTRGAGRHSGDPGVCYVMTRLNRVALVFPRG